MTNTFTLFKRLFALIAIWGFLTTSSLAQQWVDMMKKKDADLKTIRKEFEEYFKTHSNGRGTGYKQFLRWEYENQFNVDAEGNWISDRQVWEEVSNFKRNYRQAKGLKLAAGADPQVLAAGNSNWVELGPKSWNRTSGWNPGVGRVTGIAVNPKNTNEIYVTSPGGGCWRTTAGGNSWTALTDNLPVLNLMSVAIDPINTNVVYIGSAGGGVLKSTNSGSTWAQATSGIPANSTIRKIIVHPTNTQIVIAATSNGVYRTTNGGTSWVQTRSGNFEDVEFKPNNANVVYASDNSKVYRSTDGGVSFALVNGITGSGRTMIAVTPANPEYVYAVQANGSEFGYLYRSTDGGANFTTRITGGASAGRNFFGYEPNGTGTGGQAWYDMAICVSPSNAEEVHIGGIIIWRSLNGGSSFTATTVWSYPNSTGYTHPDMHALEYVGNTIYTGSDGGIYKSTNRGDDYSDLSTGLGIRQFYRIGCSKTNASIVSGGAQDNGTSVWKGTSWIDWLGADGMETIIDHTNPNIIYGTTQNGGLNKSLDGGNSRSGISTPSGSGNWVTPWVMDPNNSQVLYLGYEEIWKTNNGGSSWTQLGASGLSGRFDHIVIAPSNTSYIYASKGSNIIRSTNGGLSWTNITAGLSGNIHSITVHNSDPGKVVVATSSSGKVYFSTNAGGNWTSIARNLPNITTKCVVYENGPNEGIYVGMKVGVYYTNKNMTEWIPFMDNLPNVEISELEIHYGSNKLRAATYGRGLWESPLYNPGTVNQNPIVNITGPSNNASFFAPASINFTATASDPDGTVSKVEFFNGTTPIGSDATSPYAFNWTNVAAGTYTITAKATDNLGAVTTSSAITVVVHNLRNPENPANTAAGLDYKYYEGNWSALPDFNTLTPVKTGNVTNFDLTPRNRNDQFAFSFTGYVQIPTDGIYTFYTSSDDGSKLYIGSTEVVNNDGLHGDQERSGSIGLRAGKHALTVTFFEQGGGEILNVSYSSSGITKQAIPATALFRGIVIPTRATLYQHCNFDPAGYGVALEAGDYTTAQLTARGIMNNDVSSLKVTSGYEVVLYDLDNFQGASQTFKADDACLVDNSINDWASSLRIRVATNALPTVAITAPAANASFTAGSNITISANATDSDGSITKVAFYQGTTLLGEDLTTPYSVVWNNVGAGNYSLTAVATDNSGATVTSGAIAITVTAPADCGVPGSLAVSSITTTSATLSWAAQAGAQNYLVWWRPVGGDWLGNTTVTTTSASATGLTPGTAYEFTVRTNCATASSAFATPYRQFTTQAANAAPTVSIASPSNGASFTAPATIALTANASDSDGSIAKVEYFRGSISIGSATASPYSVTWSSVAAGNYTVTAVATDDKGATTTSAAINITVTAPPSCNTPTALGASSITTSSATVSWAAQTGAQNYTVQYRVVGAASWTTITASGASVSLSGLQSNTTYEFTVRTNCSGLSSAFASPSFQFKTTSSSICSGIAQYVENGGYVAGSRVQNSNGLYECKPWPYSGWCNGAAWAYAPGTGAYWSDAWTSVGPCTPTAPAHASKSADATSAAETIIPNPTSGSSEVELTLISENAGEEKLSIISSSGNIVKDELVKINSGENKIKVNVENLTEGIYLIRVGQKTLKFVKN